MLTSCFLSFQWQCQMCIALQVQDTKAQLSTLLTHWERLVLVRAFIPLYIHSWIHLNGLIILLSLFLDQNSRTINSQCLISTAIDFYEFNQANDCISVILHLFACYIVMGSDSLKSNGQSIMICLVWLSSIS